jgi:hypothetical protein
LVLPLQAAHKSTSSGFLPAAFAASAILWRILATLSAILPESLELSIPCLPARSHRPASNIPAPGRFQKARPGRFAFQTKVYTFGETVKALLSVL